VRSEGSDIVVVPIDDARPFIYAAERIIPTNSLQQAVQAVESAQFREATDVTAPAWVKPAGAEKVVIKPGRHGPGVFDFTVSSRGGAAIIANESYYRAWRASSDGGSLATFPANVDRLGIVVPAGQVHVTVAFGRRNLLVYFALLVSVLALAAEVFLMARSRYASAAPAR
jgi:hypothetical protein